MNSLFKIEYIMENYEKLDRFIKVLIHIPKKIKSNLEELSSLTRKYPFLDNNYKNFLLLTDGLSLDWCDFLGTTEMPSIFEYIEMWQERWDMNSLCPIAKDAAGDVFCLSPDGKVRMLDIENIGTEPILIAETFDEFINDCILGQRYKEFSSTDNNPFYKFLKEQGWV